MRKIIALAALAAGVVILTGCAAPAGSTTAAAPETTTVTETVTEPPEIVTVPDLAEAACLRAAFNKMADAFGTAGEAYGISLNMASAVSHDDYSTATMLSDDADRKSQKGYKLAGDALDDFKDCKPS